MTVTTEKVTFSDVPHPLQHDANAINGWTAVASVMRDIFTDVLQRGVIKSSNKTRITVHSLVKLGYLRAYGCDSDTPNYRLTLKGLSIRPLLRFGQSAAAQFHPGDIVTLCPTEFDGCEWNDLFVVQYALGDNYRITYPEKYVKLSPTDLTTEVQVIQEHVEYDELRHATYEEYVQGERLDYES